MIGDVFLDSGAHGLYEVTAKQFNPSDRYAFYNSDQFAAYVNTYGRWVAEHQDQLELYANVDVIFRAEKTWKVQKHLEKEFGLRPVPTVHFDKNVSNLDWLRRYIDDGHKVIAFGGLGQEVSKSGYSKSAWAEKAFEMVAKRAPKTRIHGFAMSSVDLLMEFDWDSVDSTSWFQAPRFGSLKIPVKRKGKYDHSRTPMTVPMSRNQVRKKRKIEEVYDGRVLARICLPKQIKAAMKQAQEWCEANDICYEEAQEHYGERVKAGIIYFSQMTKAQAVKFYFSGSMVYGYRPQDVLDKAHLMPSFKDIYEDGKNIAAEKWHLSLLDANARP